MLDKNPRATGSFFKVAGVGTGLGTIAAALMVVWTPAAIGALAAGGGSSILAWEGGKRMEAQPAESEVNKAVDARMAQIQQSRERRPD